jgi:DNA-binding PadR family transcriptional regulator
MSPVFRHGSLRLYLLKLLDEEPRHGYEIIRLLQDRFLGVYAPSPGTIYPRLARLEEEGLVTHDEIDGRKVYRITDRGREELHARTDDLAELEEELTASIRDIAREVSEDVRETVRSLREELASAAREMNRTRAGAGAQQSREAGPSAQQKARRAKSGKGGESKTDDVWSQAGDAWDETDDAWARAGDEAGRPRGDRGRRGWGDWPGWIGGPDWGGGPGWGGWPGGAGPQGRPSYRTFRDLERMARQFARELRTAAWHAQAISEDALGDLRVILDETLDRIKAEVFTGTSGPRRPTDSTSGPRQPTESTGGPGPEDGRAAGSGAAEGSGPPPDEGPGSRGDGPGPGPGTGPRPDADPPADS